eukprot:TRINITY_DN9687_c0_g1_i6.p1 TRINITY_DN9687_c0_g1~~TRINITY_DN9687_c0_g1_i6.p1  ORF type:complete len:148 (+),score=0.64 TRINITY_DN9687_c0_g1_i6:342-785(+)
MVDAALLCTLPWGTSFVTACHACCDNHPYMKVVHCWRVLACMPTCVFGIACLSRVQTSITGVMSVCHRYPEASDCGNHRCTCIDACAVIGFALSFGSCVFSGFRKARMTIADILVWLWHFTSTKHFFMTVKNDFDTPPSYSNTHTHT